MLTIENLKAAGADVDSGIARCAGSEEFYLKIAGMVIGNENYDTLKQLLEEKNLDQGFECAHGLKGIVANASLDNLLKPVSEMTELLRVHTDTDYTPYLDEMFRVLETYRALM